MKTKLIKIGNSKGVRLPKAVIEQCHFEDEVELDVRDNVVLIRSAKETRAGWNEAFAKMAENKDDRLLDNLSSSHFDEDEWQW